MINGRSHLELLGWHNALKCRGVRRYCESECSGLESHIALYRGICRVGRLPYLKVSHGVAMWAGRKFARKPQDLNFPESIDLGPAGGTGESAGNSPEVLDVE
jgi:hypothetical protein